ncbi:MAG: hypothetical protein IJR99_03720 [Kiritimatiellae bacterium]|nr:hypothetical protein [Kiritimatiellia bacterium]
MKLNKENSAIQRAIRKALESGKSLGGLLLGIAATAITGCRERTPANTMGRYPSRPEQQNACQEVEDPAAVRGKMILSPQKAEKEEDSKTKEESEKATGETEKR